uniref:ATPase n=1 Tax=Chlorobium chlorochromatii (strain CaD3) TaxID=340177 RepID=Q3APZ8_CHLCH
MKQELLVECKNVAVEFGGVRVLEDVTFSLNKGELLGIVGPNGGGKTTLLRLLLGLEKAASGTISLFGKAPGMCPRRIGYVPQRLLFDRDFPLSIQELVLMGRLSSKKMGERYNHHDYERAKAALLQVGLERHAKRWCGELSGGQLQRAFIARALAGDPELLLLDEPTASIDPQMKTTLYDLIESLKAHLTMILVSHDTEAISHHVTRMVSLNVTLTPLQQPFPACSHPSACYL